MLDALIVAYFIITMIVSFFTADKFLRRLHRRYGLTLRPGLGAVFLVPSVYVAAMAYSLLWPVLLLGPLNDWFWPWFARNLPNVYLAVMFSAIRMKDFQ